MPLRNPKAFLKFLASIQLAVFVLITLAILIAWGTFVESYYQDSQRAKVEVYQSLWMYLSLGLLALNLTAVIVDRWPWKRKHLPFLAAHFGILILLLGAWITQQWGIDGTMSLEPHQESKFIYLPETEINVWSSFDGQNFVRLLGLDVDFYRNPPRRSPIELPLEDKKLSILDWHPYVLASKKIRQARGKQGRAAVQIQVKNPFAEVNEWIVMNKPLGGEGELFLWPTFGDFFLSISGRSRLAT